VQAFETFSYWTIAPQAIADFAKPQWSPVGTNFSRDVGEAGELGLVRRRKQKPINQLISHLMLVSIQSSHLIHLL
jgi:hypothetical protein